MPKSLNLILGIVIGSILTALIFGLPFGGFLGNFFFPGILGILIIAALPLPGALLASIVAGRKESLVGLVSGALGLLGAIPILMVGPFFSSGFVQFADMVPFLSVPFLAFVVVGALVGGIVGKIRHRTKPSKSTDNKQE